MNFNLASGNFRNSVQHNLYHPRSPTYVCRVSGRFLVFLRLRCGQAFNSHNFFILNAENTPLNFTKQYMLLICLRKLTKFYEISFLEEGRVNKIGKTKKLKAMRTC